VPRDPRYDVLFEPVKIGPVTAPNRFYQVPHCTGMGYRMPRTLAAMREAKAEGGWGVVCTEYCSIHTSSDDDPLPFASLWDEDDVRTQALMVEKVHRHGALAGVELWYGGGASGNLHSREAPMGPWSEPADRHPVQCGTMDAADIRSLRRWHALAARRAQRAGFDIVYVYACHGYLLSQFLSPANRRADEYGGSFTNRVRLLRELIEETLEAVGDTCAVAVRFSANGGPDDRPDVEEPRATLELLGELPDLWDITISDYSREMGTSRFVKEGELRDSVAWVKQVTSKPVVSVGRFTTPDTMLSQIASRTSASASAATSAIRETRSAFRSAAPRTLRWARSGGGTGIRSAFPSEPRTEACSWWARVPPGSRRRGLWASAAIA
jgi:dimethylamine/trimethylamine dehydrogenase